MHYNADGLKIIQYTILFGSNKIWTKKWAQNDLIKMKNNCLNSKKNDKDLDAFVHFPN